MARHEGRCFSGATEGRRGEKKKKKKKRKKKREKTKKKRMRKGILSWLGVGGCVYVRKSWREKKKEGRLWKRAERQVKRRRRISSQKGAVFCAGWLKGKGICSCERDHLYAGGEVVTSFGRGGAFLLR